MHESKGYIANGTDIAQIAADADHCLCWIKKTGTYILPDQTICNDRGL